MTDTTTTTVDPKAEAEAARKARIISTIRRGGVGTLRPPDPPTGHADLDQSIVNYRRLFAEHKTARTDLAKLENERKQAVEQDKTAWANALVEGTEKDPGTKATDKADATLVVQRRKVDALSTAVDQAVNVVLATAAHAHDTVQGHARQQATTALAAAAPALDALAGIAHTLASARALDRWADTPANGYHEQAVDTPLLRVNGLPYTVAELLGAVRSALTR